MDPNISLVARLIGDPSRAKMLAVLMGGKALTATELALASDITPQTASSHLGKLVDGKLLAVRRQGRHKYFCLYDATVAQAIESLLNITAMSELTRVRTGPTDKALRKARVCYDHMAGTVSVALYDSLVDNGYIIEELNNAVLSLNGKSFFIGLGADLTSLSNGKRPICKSCLDWSERRSHLAGALGQWVLEDIFSRDWAYKDLNSRTIHFSKDGFKHMQNRYKIDLKLISSL